jgi:deazaflavin-dependent oxidoreductase (nitroreductase family)
MAMQDFNAKVIEEFRANHRKVGGGFEGAPMVLLTTTGARTRQRRTPLVQGDRLYVVASKGGAPADPDWYRNLVANPEYGDETFRAEAVPVSGEERYAAQVAAQPGFGEYQKKTDRVIPIVELRRLD